MRDPQQWVDDDLVDDDELDTVIGAWGRGVLDAFLGRDEPVWVHTSDGENVHGVVVRVEPEWVFLHDDEHALPQDHFAIKRTAIHRVDYANKFELRSC